MGMRSKLPVFHWSVVLQGCTGVSAVHCLSQKQKELPHFAMPSLLVMCWLPSAAHFNLPLLPSLQHQGQRPHGAADNHLKHEEHSTSMFQGVCATTLCNTESIPPGQIAKNWTLTQPWLSAQQSVKPF